MTAAIFGLLGVVVGGALNAAAALWKERRRERREVRPTARLVMTELSEIQAVLIADAHRAFEYRVGQTPPPTVWPEGQGALASVVDGKTWTALNNAYMMAEYIFVREEGELPMRALYGRAWLPHEISAAIYRAQACLKRYADLPSDYQPPGPIRPTADVDDEEFDDEEFDDAELDALVALDDGAADARFAVVWPADPAELEGDLLVIDRAAGFSPEDLADITAPPGSAIRAEEGSIGKGASGTGVALVLEIAEHVINDVASLIALGYFARSLVAKISERRGRLPANASSTALAALAAADTPSIAEAPGAWYHTRTVPLTTDGASGTDMRDIWASAFVDDSRGIVQVVFSSSTTRHLGVVVVAQEWFFDGAEGHLRTDAELAALHKLRFAT